jgi:hypothetical protein
MAEITQAIEMDEGAKETKWSALLAPQNRKRVMITFLLGFFSQWVVRPISTNVYPLTERIDGPLTRFHRVTASCRTT